MVHMDFEDAAVEAFKHFCRHQAKSLVDNGAKRVEQLVARKAEWGTLPTTKKQHRERRVIDRRFDGPRHRRTRDPRMFEDGADGCSLM